MQKEYAILDKIDSPADLKELGPDELIQLASELRDFIIDIVSINPGHFGASLGVVELTIALHHVFDTPEDRIIWDVGHQAYGHKILTGRKKKFHTNRKFKGLSGFPSPSESEYDAFGVGHASTSISAALGIALASQHQKKDERQVIAVIGDGALTGGLAFEGLNNAGSEKSNILVILNDNDIAIDPNVGAIKEYLIDITTSKTYNRFRNDIWNILGALSKLGPNAQKYAAQIETGVKSMFLKQSNMFESLNFRYFGPVDGHDILHLTEILKDMKRIQGPKLLHVKTKKGKGFAQAEENQTAFHSPGKFDRETGKIHIGSREEKQPPKFQDVFGHTLLELARKNEKIIGITPAMPTGSSLKIMMDELPERTYDVGIAEQHAVTFSAGLAIEGMVPFCNIYSSFMQRSYDQTIHDVALQNLPVVFCLDRGGLVGDDGPTHHGAYDLAFMRCIPNMIVSAPMDEESLRNLMYTAQLRNHGPFSIRYPRGRGIMPDWKRSFKEIPIGKGRLVKKGTDIAILSIGTAGNLVTDAIDLLEDSHINAAHYDMRFVKPIDEDLLHKVFKQFKNIITVEDGTLSGGFGAAILEFMCDNGYTNQVKRLGIPDRFIEHGTPMELFKECGFDPESIAITVKSLVKPKVLFRAV
ncbi:1-deoxy-D-xylulose-5-phosphate synthase [Bacteroidota bacterium]